MKISSRSREVAQKIGDREAFQTYGALRAEVVNGLSVWDSGQLSGPDNDRFRDDPLGIEYVVYSYATPIAWWHRAYGWHIVSQKFSRTTSVHQGKTYLIPSWDYETIAYSLSDCKHWGTPGPDCSGPRVGITRDGVILCEKHYNQQ